MPSDSVNNNQVSTSSDLINNNHVELTPDSVQNIYNNNFQPIADDVFNNTYSSGYNTIDTQDLRSSADLNDKKKNQLLPIVNSTKCRQSSVNQIPVSNEPKRPVPAPRRLRNVKPGLQQTVVLDYSKVENLNIPKFKRTECFVDEINSPKIPISLQFSYHDTDESSKLINNI